MTNKDIRKIFVLDTSVLIYHEDSIHGFPDTDVVIPMVVLEEIDNIKTRNDSAGNSARYINRFLDKLRDKGSLKVGVALDNGQTITVSTDSDISILPSGMSDSNDNRIISVAAKLSRDSDNVFLISRDINVRVKCDSLGLKAENYIKEKATVERRGAFTGVSVINMASDQIDSFYKDGFIGAEDFDLEPNEFVVVKGGQQSALASFRAGKIRPLIFAGARDFGIEGIFPRNKEQAFAMDMLLDNNIHLATITGKSGCGKTLLAAVSAIHQLNLGTYDKIIISRPTESMSADIGYLPGLLEEKMAPWLQPIFDNLEIIFKNGRDYLDLMVEKGIIEIQALSHIRGRSLPRTLFILDESQNITLHEAKAVITRMGEGSKLIMLGDLEQIDAPHLDSSTCGLGVIVERFKDFELAGHITLLKGVRSPLATHAAEIL
jgi:PhoH-like ATPase